MSTSIGKDNYSAFAERYAHIITTKPHNAYYERPATLSLLPDVDGLRVLDAGCGSGINSEYLLQKGAQLTALDATPDFVKMTQNKVGGNAKVLLWNLEDPLTFAQENAFDLILCSLVLDYIEDWSPVFKEFARVLDTNGMLIFSCGHPAADFYRYHPEDTYFQTTLHEELWHGFGEPYPVIRSYRRPLQAILNPLIDAGFHLDTVLEPQPVPALKEMPEHREVYETLMKHPGFLHIRAINNN